MRRLLRRILVVKALAVSPLVGGLAAQSDAGPLRGQAMGMSMDRFMYEGIGVVAMTYRYSSLHPGGVAPELGISLFPQSLPAGVLAIAPDLGASYNVTIPGGSVLFKTGGSALAAMGTGGAVFVPGIHVGGTALFKMGHTSGMRIDIIRHYYWISEGEIEPIWSIGLGFAILPRRR